MKLAPGLTAFALCFSLAACTGSDTSPMAEDAARRAAEKVTLPVSYNDVMVALVNDAADPLWMAAWKNPESDRQWRELERRAYQLKLAGALLRLPANGPLDQRWAAQPGWQKWAAELELAGGAAIAAVQARSVDRISLAGDQIVEVCEGCHTDFKLTLPTGGKYGELSKLPASP
jgi:hypothetical protein